MEPSKDFDGKKSENNLLFRPVNQCEELSLQSNPQFLEDDDAWMREDAISLEDEDEEKPEVLPFGLNQSWPRVSRPSTRRDTVPRVHPKKKLLRQISRESLDESTNLLLGHIVMLPEPPHDLISEPSLPTFAKHPLVEEEDEQLQVEMEKKLNICEERRNPDVQKKEEDSFLALNVQVLGDRISGKHMEEQKLILPDLDSIEKDCCNSNDNQLQIPTASVQCKSGKDNVEDNCEEKIMRESNEAPTDCEIKEPNADGLNQSLQNLKLDSGLQVTSSDEGLETESGIENETKEVSSDLKLSASHIDTKVDLNQDVPKDYLEKYREIDVSLDVSTNPERSVRKKSSPGERKRPPLLRYLSQESIEESTNLLMDHVVMMDLQQKPNQRSPEGRDLTCPFLVDIKESPLLDEDASRRTENEKDEMFLYQGEVDSCDEEEEEDVGHEDDREETSKHDYLHTIADMNSMSFISDEAASTLQDIELIRVELDNAIHTFQGLIEEFPERTDESLLPKADDVFLEDIDDEEAGDVSGDEDGSVFRVLPDELLIHIFKHFSHDELCDPIMLVCKKWNSLAKDPLLWQYLDLSNKAGIPSDVLGSVFQRCNLLCGITFRGRDEVSASEIQAIIDHCPNVPSLEFGFVRTMQDDQFSLLIGSCRSLTSLNMEGCDGITDSLISRLILLPKLRCLNLSHCTKLTDGAVFEIARFCDHLEELDIDGIPWITDIAVTMLCDERQAKLRCLRLDGAELTDISIHHAVQCPNLEELSSSFCEQLTDHSLTMLKKWKKPVRLRLQKGKEFSEEALANLFISPQMSNLTYLDLSECSELRDPGLINIATRCPLLTHLAIEWCWFISDVGLVQVLDNCSLLKHLDLIGLHAILGHCLADVPTKLPQLDFLDLRQCNRITDAMLVQIVSMKHNLVIMNYYGEEVVHGNLPGTLDL
ncbi:uncharacterized protein LOC578435 [Strongylocentrotus purpuratus]|uniref:F-box domain-containing protein n=1 Tax=Strongylocentrotus purpuratus TaxID=7668 RepID=A0A7M7RAH4_STRPU|nr:uncharacterized protein LOC578435 [Strongylocentrotus purpuratus]XP_783695.2 uncharacterized protein LOC578435 [Strongylocentrotus purpuratus]